jgi:hypothetical protein
MNFNKIGILEIDEERVALRPLELRHEYGENTILKAEIMSIFKESNARSRKKNIIKNVIFNDPATIVIWGDGTKTVVKCQPGDTYDKEKGLALCISKKYLGNKGNFNEVFKKWITEERIVYKDTKIGGPKVGTKIKIIDTMQGCLGAVGKIGIVTYKDHTSGLLREDRGYNVKTEDNRIWRINPEAKIEIL